MTVDKLLAYLFDNTPHLLAAPLADRLNQSPRFLTFVETYRDKIRKKIRSTPDAEGFRDLWAELEIVWWLLQERRFSVEYEPYNRRTSRGPDFLVAFKTNTTFNVEVTRMRFLERKQDSPDQPLANLDLPYLAIRLSEIVGSKLGQMLPGMVNLLVIIADSQAICDLDLDKAMRHLKLRAEQKDPILFARHDFRSASDFFKYYQRFSGLLVRGQEASEPRQCSVLWLNNQAKHIIPANIRTVLKNR
jgi:hypothetical protein